MINIIEDSIFNSPEQYICHQCNAISHGAGGLAYSLFKQYPYANIYANRTGPDTPGDIIIKGNGLDQRYIINMIGQYYPGYSGKISGYGVPDSANDRQDYFQQCLDRIALIDNLESIAFPYKIGCDLAGGDWNVYSHMLEQFAEQLKDKVKVVIYKYDPKEI
jgi:O-acetyl-ADP-ribose deacetylase (regulator of RNase III)